MSQVIADRYTTQIDQPFVVFLVGMRVNNFLAFKKWMMVAGAFPKMVETLEAHPEKGFLGGEQFFRPFPLTTIMVSYWRSFEDLERFARGKDDPHAEVWRKFNKEVGYNGDVGVWHETYAVEPGKYEALYANMPLFGLAKATHKTLPVHGGALRHARGRLQQQEVQLPEELQVYE
ncbi:MAG: DUF4188 domain-containing protein [Anaerolineae bacterium]